MDFKSFKRYKVVVVLLLNAVFNRNRDTHIYISFSVFWISSIWWQYGRYVYAIYVGWSLFLTSSYFYS